MKNSEPHRVQRGSPASRSRRELGQRSAGGLEVVLYWNGDGDSVTVSVRDVAPGGDFELVVEAANALDAFRHPYAYAAARGVPYGLPAADSALGDG